MYPARYAKIELVNEDKTSGNYKSLVKTLNAMVPVSALTFDKKAFESAACFAKEQSVSGEIGHDRKNCKSYFLENVAPMECLQARILSFSY